MGTLKRTYHLAGDDAERVSKRLRRVESASRRNKPAMRNKRFITVATIAANSINSVELSAISDGDIVSNRQGNKIKIHRIEVRGNCHHQLDCYIIQSHTTTLPTYGNFSSNNGAFLDDEELNTKFSEWAYFKPYTFAGTSANG